jgi:cell division protein FtsZ
MDILAVREEDTALRFPVMQSGPQGPVGLQEQEEEVSTIIKVIGAGGGGSNSVNRMIEYGVSGVEFIAVNTDIEALKNSNAPARLQIGSKLTGGRGAGGKPEVGEKAAEEDIELLTRSIEGANMVFVTAGMGGGTGTGSAPVIARIARECGALTVGVVTKPFDCEGRYKMKLAEDGIQKLREAVDSLIIVPNQNLFKMVDRNTSIKQAYKMADDVLRQSVQGISDIITKIGEVNIDFADVESIMKGQGDAIMGIGIGEGQDRAKEAAMSAIENQLLDDIHIDGATKILVNISCSEELGLVELEELMNTIRVNADPDAEILSGVLFDPLLNGKVMVTVIATGFRKFDDQILIGKTDDTRAGKSKDSDFLDFGEYQKIRDRTRPEYLGPRNYQDDLEVPTAIRERVYAKSTENAPSEAFRDIFSYGKTAEREM